MWSAVVAEPGFVAGTAPGPGFGFGAVDEFGPETVPGVEVGPVAVSEPVFEMELVTGRDIEVGHWTEGVPGMWPGPGAWLGFGLGTETEPEVDVE